MAVINLIIDQPQSVTAADLVLSQTEKARAASMAAPQAALFRAARSCVRHVLADDMFCAPAHVPLQQPGTGRISLQPGAKGPAFSVSHTVTDDGGWFAVAVSQAPTIGVDIEMPTRPVNWRRLATRRFSEQELAQIDRAGTDAKLRFFQLWTLKEAHLKMAGGQLLTHLRHTRFTLSGPRPERGEGTDQYYSYSLASGLVIAVASPDPVRQIECRTFSGDRLETCPIEPLLLAEKSR